MALYLGSTGITKAYLGATEITKAYLGATEVFSASGFSAEAQQYFDRLDAAGDTTYTAYKQPIANYIDGLVSNSLWDGLESSALFVGVGFEGITVPLRSDMPTLTNNNFVSGDLSVTDGLLGDGSTKYIDTGVTTTTLSINDASMSVRLTADRDVGSTAVYIGGSTSNFAVINNPTGFRSRHFGSTLSTNGSSTSSDTLIGISRDNASDYDWRDGGLNGTNIVSSATQTANEIAVFSADGGSLLASSRLATYHAGAALDLATLETLQDTLISEIAAI